MAVKTDLADDAHRARLGLDAVELDAVVGGVALDPGQAFEEIEMPPRAPVFAVGDRLKADLFLLLDDLLDLAVLDLLELRGGDGAGLALRARVFDGRRAQDAADVVGAERRLGSFH